MTGSEIARLISAFSYPAVFLLTLGAGIGLPVSEELVFFLGGIAVARGGGSFWGTAACAMVGTLLGDLFLYRVGHTLGPAAARHPKIGRVLTPARVAQLQGYFERWGGFTVFVAGFVAGLRLPTFVMAGVSGMRLRRFFLADAICVSLFAPALMFLGFRFGAGAWAHFRGMGAWGLLAVLVILVAAVLFHLRRRKVSSIRK